MKKDYEPPAIRDLGTLAELTSQCYNKIGSSTDTFSAQNDTIGSFVAVAFGPFK